MPFRLFEVGVTRFVRDQTGAGLVENGRVNALGTFTLVARNPSTAVEDVRADLVGRSLIYTEAWFALGELGPEARANFRLGNGGQAAVVRGLLYYAVETDPQARVDSAQVVNLSTRGTIITGTVPALIGGFVIDGLPGQTRKVLLRAVGPSLLSFGVTDAAPDPALTLQSGSTVLFFNGGWADRVDVAAIETASGVVGAFALPRGSKDAALLVDLPPGSYTAGVTAEGSSAGGTALLEIYVLP